MIALSTWIAVAILIVGSLAVFVWFLLDLVRMARADRERGNGADP